MLRSESLERVLVSFALCSSKLGTVLCVVPAMHSVKVKKPVWCKTAQVQEKEGHDMKMLTMARNITLLK